MKLAVMMGTAKLFNIALTLFCSVGLFNGDERQRRISLRCFLPSEAFRTKYQIEREREIERKNGSREYFTGAGPLV